LWIRRHSYPLLGVALLTFFLLTYLLADALELPMLTDARPLVQDGSWPTALLGFGLLVSDVALPVPSSAVMVAQGAAFGAVSGAALSWFGGTATTAATYLVGRRSSGWVHRLVSPAEQRRAAALMVRHGIWGVIITRPVPMLAETVAILAGVERLPWWHVVLAGAAGNLAPAVAYAAVGALAASYVNGALVFGAVCLLAALVGIVQLGARRTSMLRQLS
jgi:uncharacterized membrane protein YdjX (TVP38/TMEM64 family)